MGVSRADIAVAPTNAGDCTVRFRGDVLLDDSDVDRVTGISQAADGEYILEFVSAVDAALWREKLERTMPTVAAPPGLLPPPGLDAPPGLEPPASFATSAATVPRKGTPCTKNVQKMAPAPDLTGTSNKYEVLVSGIPNEICFLPMLEVVLEQAGLENVQADIALTGRGTAVIGFQDLNAAERCKQHFLGCRWGSARVTAEISGPPSSSLSAQATVFSPALRKEVPCFTPSWLDAKSTSSGSRCLTGSGRNSETSTEAAYDSEAELSEGSAQAA